MDQGRAADGAQHHVLREPLADLVGPVGLVGVGRWKGSGVDRAAFEDAGWDVTDDKRRPLRVLGHFSGPLWLAVRGVAPAALQAIEVQERDLASPASRASQFTSMLPFFVLMAVLYGALHAALDTTAGERERGSLEPLMMNPVPPLALVLGKWAAVAAVANASGSDAEKHAAALQALLAAAEERAKGAADKAKAADEKAKGAEEKAKAADAAASAAEKARGEKRDLTVEEQQEIGGKLTEVIAAGGPDAVIQVALADAGGALLDPLDRLH